MALINCFERQSESGEHLKVYVRAGKEAGLLKGMVTVQSTATAGNPPAIVHAAPIVGNELPSSGVYAVFSGEAPRPVSGKSRRVIDAPVMAKQAFETYQFAREGRQSTTADAEATMAILLDASRKSVHYLGNKAAVSASAAILFEDTERQKWSRRKKYVVMGNAGAGMVALVRDGQVVEETIPQGLFGPGWYINNLGTDSENDDIKVTEVQKGDKLFIASATIADSFDQIKPFSQEEDPLTLATALIDINQRLFSKSAVIVTV